MDKQWIPTLAGVLEIVASVCALIGGLVLAFICAVINTVPDIQDDPEVPLELLTAMFGTLSGLVLLGGLVCLVGGIAAIRRRGWAWAVAGAIAALFLATPAGVFALILV
ncbi:MAG: hypothetical protein GY769_16715, partial [bacterium]|nr:hypothetical protein [bacterium]